MSHIVKRHGHKEKYDSRKVYASVYAALLALRTHEGEAEVVADKVTREVNAWVTGKKEVTSHEIFVKTEAVLKSINPDAAFIYTTHLDVN